MLNTEKYGAEKEGREGIFALMCHMSTARERAPYQLCLVSLAEEDNAGDEKGVEKGEGRHSSGNALREYVHAPARHVRRKGLLLGGPYSNDGFFYSYISP